ncbi:MAG: PhoX family protein [Chloroflexota bacterium]|nr:PhoX family protein [Chloroflexota bacterium]
MARTRSTRSLAALTAGLLILTAAAPVSSAHPPGFRTSAPAMLEGVGGTTVTPLMTVGDTLASGYRFEAIPDGIAVNPRGHGRLDLYINHETSTVPFPYDPVAPTKLNSMNDFDNAQLSRLVLSQGSGRILSGKLVIKSSENYQRFCSNFLATKAQGFERDILFTNEETPDFVYRTGRAWPTVAGDPAAQQAGLVVAYDVKTGARKPILGMGRLNHENTVAIPGYRKVVLLTGDDTFTTNPAQSQVYAYMADDARAVWRDKGSLYGFKADNAAVNDYYDFAPGSTMSVSGTFVKIPRAAAVGNQTALENASDAAGVFQFVRIEDIAYDRNHPNIVYLADSGRASASVDNGSASTNGRIWKMVLDKHNPGKVRSLSILIDGDTAGLGVAAVMHQPDNLETTKRSLLITEDPSSANQFAVDDPNGTPARIWRYDFKSKSLTVVAKLVHTEDEGLTDKDPATSKGRWGSWEASGIVDVSKWFGRGTFLVDVQAHSLFVEIGDGPDLIAPTGPDWLRKREGGQLLLIRIPGA